MNYLLPLICTLVGIAGVIFSLILASMVRSAPAGNEKMREIANAIKTGAIAYLNRQLKSMGLAGIILFVIIGAALSWKTAIGFLIGAIASFAAGYIGMRVSVLANVRTALKCQVQPFGQAAFGGFGGSHISQHRYAHPDVTGRKRCNGAD